MNIKLPIVIRKWDEKTEKIDTKYVDFDVDIDTSFKAHLKWEEQFRDQLNCDLNTYTGRVQKILSKKKLTDSELLSLLKLLYCYVNSPKLPTFLDFCGMLDYESAPKILEKIGTVLEQIGKTASKN